MTNPLPFVSGVMRCRVCGSSQQADAHIESGWLYIKADALTLYICPACAKLPAPCCPVCQQFYHEDYRACPFCARVKGGAKP